MITLMVSPLLMALAVRLIVAGVSPYPNAKHIPSKRMSGPPTRRLEIQLLLQIFLSTLSQLLVGEVPRLPQRSIARELEQKQDLFVSS